MEQMICGNTQAEIDNDTDTNAAEQLRYVTREKKYTSDLNKLLDGQTVEGNGYSVNLAERMADKYQQFANFVDQDFDFMAHFKAGKFCDDVNKLILREACSLASFVAE